MQVLLEANSIPASRALSVRNAREPALLWVYSGTASIETTTRTYRLTAAQGLWMPAGIPYALQVDADSVAFPIFPAVGSKAPPLHHPLRVGLPASWSDWLIYQFARSIGYLRGATSDTSLLDLVTCSDPAVRGIRPQTTAHVPLPPMPSSPEASMIGRALLQKPGDPTRTTEHARCVNISVRTLQQQFLKETGMPFTKWRTAVRVAAAAALMDTGHDIGWAGLQVGFSTPTGFTKAFRARTGMTPRQYRHQCHTDACPDDIHATDFSRHMRSRLLPAAERDAAPPPIPATQTWNRINDFHVLVWVYRGSARVTIGERTHRLRRGDAIWLPAGVRNSITLSRGSLVLPLGSRRSLPALKRPPTLVQRFPEDADPYLLHTLVANYSLIRPEKHDPNHITRQFLDNALHPSSPVSEDSTVTTPVRTILQAVRSNPGDKRTLTQWAHELGTDARMLGRDFLAATGETYATWRSGVRMTVARHCLEDGMSVTQTARRLGYAHPSTFSTIFTRTHGTSPRDYQRHGWQHADEALIIR